MRSINLTILVILITILPPMTALAQVTIEPGQMLHLQGQVLDTAGAAVTDALVEIWQVDANATYNHPDDADGDDLLDDFQYFGATLTDEAGNYAFHTILPPKYDNRPPHIHIRIKQGDETLLTSQLYVELDRRNGDETQLLDIREAAPSSDADEDPGLLALANIVLDLNGADADVLTATSPDVEGPFYPLTTIADYDNNLNSTAADDEPILPLMAPEFTLINLNTGTDDEFGAIPDVGRRMIREFNEYRPYISIQQFRREINKYIDMEQVAAYEAYLYVPIDINRADAETFQQIPGVDQVVAEALITLRPFDSNDVFLTALGEHLPPWEVEFAGNFLADES